MQTKKKFLSLLMALMMVLSLLPATAFAADPTDSDPYTLLKQAIDAAPADGTETRVVLSGDITGITTDQIITIAEGKKIVLDLAGFSITVSDDFQGRPIDNDGTLTVTGNGTIDSSASQSGYGAIRNDGTLTIDNGRYIGHAYADGAAIRNGIGSKLTVNDGYFAATSAIYNAGEATLYKGEFETLSCSACGSTWAYALNNRDENGVSGKMWILPEKDEDIKVHGTQGALASAGAATVYVKGGTFYTHPCDAGHAGNTFYALYISGKNENEASCIVDGGNFSTTGNNGCIYVANGNPSDNGGEGGIAGLVINGGTFSGNEIAPVFTTGGSENATCDVTINGGSFKNGNFAVKKLKNGASVTVKGGDFTEGVDFAVTADNQILKISGGTFSSDVSDYIPTSSVITEIDGIYTVGALDEDNAAAKIGSDCYPTFAEAVKDAKTGDTVTLLKDAADTTTITISGKTVTIDLNSHEIGFSLNKHFYINANGELILTGAGRVYEQEPNYGPVVLKGNLMATQKSALKVGPEVTLEGWAGVFIDKNSNKNKGISVVVEGTLKSVKDISGSNGNGIYINGTINDTNPANAPQITLTETSRIESMGEGIYAAGYAVWNLAGDIDAGLDALSIKSGVFNITGGTYTAHGEFADPAEENNNGSEPTGAAISITSNDSYAKKIVINVSGGTFISDNGYSVYEGIAQKDGVPAAAASYVDLTISDGNFTGASDKGAVMLAAMENKEVISGGYFTSDPSEYVAEDLAVVSSDKEGYRYMVGAAVSGVSLDKTELDLAVGETAELVASIEPEDAADKTLNWSSDDDTIATVDENGKVTAVAPGTVVITVTTVDGEMTATCQVTVREEVVVRFETALGTAPESMTVKKGDKITLPEALTAYGYIFTGWKSGNTVYRAGSEVTVTEAMTFVAQWNKIIAGGVATPSYTVTAPDNVKGGSVKVSDSRAEKGETVTITVTPSEGYELKDIAVTDQAGNALKLTQKSENKFAFQMPASKVFIDVTFAKIEKEVIDMPFVDVFESDWYYDEVAYVYEKGLMGGSDRVETFCPAAPTTRAMLVTILYRLEGEPAVAGASAYTDVSAGQYYTDAVIWATQNKIVEGYDGQFRPNDTLTRQDLVAILYRYAAYKGYDTSARADLSAYTDAAEVSDYAVEAMSWAKAEGLITGDTLITISPKNGSTRAMMATVLMHFVENVTR